MMNALNRGVIRNIMVRRGRAYAADDACVGGAHLASAASRMILSKRSRWLLPEVTSVVVNLNDQTYQRDSRAASHEPFTARDYLLDKLLGSEFQISPVSFYQVNPIQTEVLYTKGH